MSGGRKPTISDSEIILHIADEPDPILSTSEIADHFGFSQPGMLSRLRKLEDKGMLKSKKVGNSNAWWLSELGKSKVSD